jgi:HAD superfamily hydrolase (TIGR01509 family)
VTGVLFDMDGTLLRLEVDIEEVRLQLAALFGPFGVTRPFRPVLPRIREAAREAVARGGDEQSLAAQGFAILSRFEVDGARSARPREGARDVVNALHARGVPLGIVTDNGSACVPVALAAAGLPAGAFTVIVTRDELAAPKPDPEGVRKAAAALGTPSVVYIGDHAKDVTAGKAAGVRTLGLLGGHGSDGLTAAGADATLTSLAQLLDHLGERG